MIKITTTYTKMSSLFIILLNYILTIIKYIIYKKIGAVS